MKTRTFNLFAMIALLSYALAASAEVTPNSLFTDHAILQRNMVVPVWGTAKEGEKISVEFAGQKLETVTSADGKWMVKLKPLKAGGPFLMTIKGDNVVTVNDILVGEVWVCSGQSNMGFRMSQGVVNGTQEIQEANYPEIRQFSVSYKPAHEAVADTKGKWQLCTPETVKSFTAVGYFFARDLYKKFNIPFGIIYSAVGGTPAEWWTSRDAMLNAPELKQLVNQFDNAIQTYPARLEKYKQDEPSLLEKYNKELEIAKTDTAKIKKPAPRKPTPPENPILSGGAGGLYTGMIQPLQPFAIKGVIWYQGEANSSRAEQYKTLFPTLINDWRKAWGEGDFPFLFVQIAPWKGISPEIREAQLLTWQNTPNTAMAVTTDCGDAENIHPPAKQPVGLRLSLAARALAYKEKVEYSGPVYESMTVKDSTIELTFTHGKHLVAKGGVLKGFTIAGADKKFVAATAEIEGRKLIVRSPDVKAPVAVRYGWANVPDVNLYNQDDLPATPFRTDNGK